MQSYCLSFELNELPPSLNVFMRWHFRKRSAEFNKIKRNCLANISGKEPSKPLTKYSITFTRHTIRPLDIDNLVASFKPVLDSLENYKVIKSDKWEMSEHIRYKQVKVKKTVEQKVLIQVTGNI